MLETCTRLLVLAPLVRWVPCPGSSLRPAGSLPRQDDTLEVEL
jgi:hypothetical protein